MGEMTPQAMDRERAKIGYVGGEPTGEEIPFSPESPQPVSFTGVVEASKYAPVRFRRWYLL